MEFFALTPLMRDGLNPVADLGRMRATHPVLQLQIPLGPSAWLVTRYDDVRSVLGDVDLYSNSFDNLADIDGAEIFSQLDPGGLGFRDPPEHSRLRRMLTAEFTMHRLRRLTPFIEQTVATCLAAIEAGGPGTDLVATFARRIPSLVVCELLGVPDGERDELHRISNGRFEFSGDPETSLAAVNESLTYLAEVISRQRKDPGDGLLGMLIRSHGNEIDDWELAGLADGLITGGHDTTTSMISLGAFALLQNPELAQAITQDDGNTGLIVEELLRYLTVVQIAFPRFPRRDTVLGGQSIGAGEMVLCSLSSANRDETLGSEMERINPFRREVHHVAFGHGSHHCIGAPLARMELAIALPALFRAFPHLRLAYPQQELALRPFSVVYGFNSLPVAW